MIGASFFCYAPVLANTPTVGSTDNCPSELADLDKKASDNGGSSIKKLQQQIQVLLKHRWTKKLKKKLLALEKKNKENY